MYFINRKYLKQYAPILFILFLTVIFFSPVLFQGKTFFAFDILHTHLPWSHYASHLRVNNTLISDPVNNLYPYHHFLKDCIKKKILPLWYGYNFCGVPFSSGYVPQSNPIVFFSYILFPMSIAHDVVLWLYLFGAGIFAFLYLKSIDLKIIPALIGAISWMFNGYVMVFFEIESTPILACSLPAALLFIEQWFRTRQTLNCLFLTGAVAVAVSSGYVHLIIYQLMFIGIYILYRYTMERRKDKVVGQSKKNDLLCLSLALIIGVVVSINVITSFMYFLEDPQRTAISLKSLYLKTGQLPIKYLTTLVFPDFFGTPASRLCFTPSITGAQPYNNYSELCIYLGALTPFLIIACIPYFFKRKRLSFFGISALVSLTIAMGSVLYYPMVKLVPGLAYSSPTRIIYIFGFSSSMMAGIGADILTTLEKKKWVIFLFWSILVIVLVSVALFVQTKAGIQWAISSSHHLTDWRPYFGLLASHFSFSSETILRPLLIVAVSVLTLTAALTYQRSDSKTIFLIFAALILSVDLISFGLKYNTAAPKTMEYPSTKAIRFLQKDSSIFRVLPLGQFMPNALAPFGIEDIGGYHSFYPKRYGEFLHLSQHGAEFPFQDFFNRWVTLNKFGSPLLDLINVKYILLSPSVSIEWEKLQRVYNDEISIFENKDVFSRFFFVPTYQYCPTRQVAYNTLSMFSAADFKTKLILESRPPEDFQPSNESINLKVNSKIQVISYTSNRIELVVSSDKNGFLVISDNYHPQWRAKVDGTKEKILLANYIMRAIPMRKGTHRVELIYQPNLMMAGMLITGIGWAALILSIGILVFKNYSKHRKDILNS